MDDNKAQDYGKKIRILRELRGWSLRELTAKTGIAPSNLSRIERGQGYTTIESARKIAAVFDCTLSDLFEDIPTLDFEQLTSDEKVLVKMYRDENYGNMLQFIGLAMRGELENG